MPLDWLPAAVRDPHGRALAWAETTDPKGVLHTTESSSWPGYRNWADAPHATIMPTPGKGVTIRQHIPFSRASFALVHAAGQQATNTDFAFQFELIGTSEKGGPGYYWPGADDDVLLDLYHKLIKPLSDAYGIPLRAPTWLPYPASYGATRVRLSSAQWDTYSGWLGHQHAPQNLHGDPGAFPWDRMMRLAAGPQEDDMPLTEDDVARIARAVHNQILGGSTITVGAALDVLYRRTGPTPEQIAQAVRAALPTGGTVAGGLSDADVARLRKEIVDEISSRLVR
jgi:hypothetical protein